MPFGDRLNAGSLGLSKVEISKIAEGWEPVLSPKRAAKMIGVPLKTIYEWSSAGRLDRCARRRGKRLHILRDRFVKEFFDGEAW